MEKPFLLLFLRFVTGFVFIFSQYGENHLIKQIL